MKADFHIHTDFSYDAEVPAERMIQEAIKRGLKTICITDHQDPDCVEPAEFDLKEYFLMLEMLQEKYKSQIEVLIGMEFGMQPHLGSTCEQLSKHYPFDYIIGSVHLVDGYDPYYPEYFQTHSDEVGYRRYFELILDGLRVTKEIDALGHLDYIVCYGTKKEKTYSYAKYADIIDEILRFLIENEKALEVNTAGLAKGLGFAYPHRDVLHRYRELGGEMLAIGSDAHKPEYLAYEFSTMKSYLSACGFKYYTEFRQRKPIFCAI